MACEDCSCECPLLSLPTSGSFDSRVLQTNTVDSDSESSSVDGDGETAGLRRTSSLSDLEPLYYYRPPPRGEPPSEWTRRNCILRPASLRLAVVLQPTGTEPPPPPPPPRTQHQSVVDADEPSVSAMKLSRRVGSSGALTSPLSPPVTPSALAFPGASSSSSIPRSVGDCLYEAGHSWQWFPAIPSDAPQPAAQRPLFESPNVQSLVSINEAPKTAKASSAHAAYCTFWNALCEYHLQFLSESEKKLVESSLRATKTKLVAPTARSYGQKPRSEMEQAADETSAQSDSSQLVLFPFFFPTAAVNHAAAAITTAPESSTTTATSRTTTPLSQRMKSTPIPPVQQSAPQFNGGGGGGRSTGVNGNAVQVERELVLVEDEDEDAQMDSSNRLTTQT